mmetsp:Transcript_24613/g.35233  ORF Transcript_24613/g.35233 Transcript_24613/m.35233 type:complete len:90 (+) Transcript_24613:504-773(+)
MADIFPMMYADIEAQNVATPPGSLNDQLEEPASMAASSDDEDEEAVVLHTRRPTVQLTYRPRILALHGIMYRTRAIQGHSLFLHQKVKL